MARASLRTHLTLDRFARIIGLSPVHFSGAAAQSVFPIVSGKACDAVWPQHTWQTSEEYVSREDVARAIYDAERDVAAVLGYAVAPQFSVEELHTYPRNRTYFRRDTQIKTKLGKVIAPGRRGLEAVELGAPVAYLDLDGDGWAETARITLETELEDLRELKIYSAGKQGDPTYEIRYPKQVERLGEFVVLEFDAWLFIKPDLWERFPTPTGFSEINVETTANYVETVDAYREFVDYTQPSAIFIRRGRNGYGAVGFCESCRGAGCSACGLSTQTGCLSIADGQMGLVAASAGVWSDETQMWQRHGLGGGEPEQVSLFYYAGKYAEEYLNGYTYDPLDQHLAVAITWLAAANIEKRWCGCSNANETISELRRDLAISTRDAFAVRYSTQQIFTNPFGTRSGHVRAWERVANLIQDQVWESAGF